ncbi:hypothetical protein [Actinoplanes sp. ATCC 53533]|uniref:hypothetical protein n=1 Tax=Actinoplanes sp. ATCC 53533 TaxID=1288362 RepID=UPI000F7953A4|nr:hypothetical protein [Actinoplanes sp. ATCC 53533]
MNGEPGRGRLSPPLLVSGLVLGLDAIACQLLALVLAVLMWPILWPSAEATGLTVAAVQLGVATLLALWCPAAAALVLGVRSRKARLTGLATAAVLVVAGAAFAADGLVAGGGTPGQLIAGLVVTLVNLGVVTLLVTPAPRVTSAPARLIDLDAGDALP